MSDRYHCEKTDEEFQKKLKEPVGVAVLFTGEGEAVDGGGGGAGRRLLVISPLGVAGGGVKSDRAVPT